LHLLPAHYNYYRDYDPSIGRYIQSDPIGLRGGANTYGYVGGAPLTHIDPYGNFFFFAAVPLIAGGAVSLGEVGAAVAGGAAVFALMVTPGDSEAAQQKADRDAYHKVCDEPPPPGLSFCDEVRWKIHREKTCISMRKQYMSKWNDTYEGHSNQISLREAGLRRLERLLEEKCCGK